MRLRRLDAPYTLLGAPNACLLSPAGISAQWRPAHASNHRSTVHICDHSASFFKLIHFLAFGFSVLSGSGGALGDLVCVPASARRASRSGSRVAEGVVVVVLGNLGAAAAGVGAVAVEFGFGEEAGAGAGEDAAPRRLSATANVEKIS
jgi:hypothetical protein